MEQHREEIAQVGKDNRWASKGTNIIKALTHVAACMYVSMYVSVRVYVAFVCLRLYAYFLSGNEAICVPSAYIFYR